MRIFVDFDYTLCNTALLKESIFSVAHKHGVSLVPLPESRETFERIGHYTLRKHLELSHCPSDSVEEIEQDFFAHASQWLYADAADFFQRNSQHIITVLSYGDVDFQRRKIESSGIAELAHGVICTPGTKVEALRAHLQSSEPFVIIDDRATHLNAVCAVFPQARPVRILRAESPYHAEIATCTPYTTHDLLFQVDALQ